ncbi:hypothetical protein [Actinophytocola sp.]|uniref:hypothetical protein n=1 Tax=Actinophytocola sp. TaxID=1872138 RepID=UPI003D6A92CB
MLTDLARRYRWAGEVVRRYGGDPGRPAGGSTFTQLADVQGDNDDPRCHLQVIVHGRHVIAVEHYGWVGVVPEIARRWLDARRPAYRIPGPDALLRDVPGAWEP